MKRPVQYYDAAIQCFNTELKACIKGKRSSVCVCAFVCVCVCVCVYLLDFSKIISLISSYSITSAESK